MKKIILMFAFILIPAMANANNILSSSSILIKPSPVSLNVQVVEVDTGIMIEIYIPTENRLENILGN